VTNPCDPPVKSTIKIGIGPGQAPEDLLRFAVRLRTFDPMGAAVIRRGTLQSEQQAYGYFGQACGGFPSGGVVPYSALSGLVYPFRDFLVDVLNPPPAIPGQNNSSVDNGIESGALNPRSASLPSSQVTGILGRQRTDVYGLGRCNIGDGVEFPIQVFQGSVQVGDFHQHNILVEMDAPGQDNLVRMADNSVQRLVLTPGRFLISVGGATPSACVQWFARGQTSPPTARKFPAFAYDSVRHESVLFGGETAAGTPLTDANAYLWRGSSWQVVPTTGVLARSRSAMAFDTSRGVMVMYGGVRVGPTAPVPMSDTVEWNGSTWTTRFASSTPGVRSGHAMAYDAARGRTVLFGGQSASALNGQTHTYNGTSWTLASSSGPGARYGHMMAYDSTRQRVVLYGGRVSSTATPLSDTWEWNGTSWASIPVSGPGPRAEGAMVYDSLRQRVVLFQGSNSGNSITSSVYEYDGSAWTQVLPVDPPARSGAGGAFDSSRGVSVFSCGGLSPTIVTNQLFEYGRIAAPTLVSHPASQQVCVGADVTFSVQASGPELAYQWRFNGENIEDEDSPVLVLTDAARAHAGLYDCLVSNSCSVVISNAGVLSFPPCVADVDDGTGTGACDGGTTIDDLLYYLVTFEEGSLQADVDDGSETGTPDGGVTIDDLVYYLSRFEGGC
jgi:hypothetical protein